MIVLVQSMIFHPVPAQAATVVNGVAPDFMGLKAMDFQLDVSITGGSPSENIAVTWRRAEGKNPGDILTNKVISRYRIEFLGADSNKIDQAKMENDAAYANKICAGNAGWRTAYHGNDKPAEGNDVVEGNLGSAAQGRINWQLDLPFRGTHAISEPGYIRVVAVSIEDNFASNAVKAGIKTPFPITCAAKTIEPPLSAPTGYVNLRLKATDKDGNPLSANVTIDGKRPIELGASKNTTTLTFLTKREVAVTGGTSYSPTIGPDSTKPHTFKFELNGYKSVERQFFYYMSTSVNIVMGKEGTDEESKITDTPDDSRDKGGALTSDQAKNLQDCGEYLGFQSVANTVKNRRVFAFEPVRYIACQLLNTLTQMGIWILKYADAAPY